MNIPESPRARCLAALDGAAVQPVPAYTPTLANDVAAALLGRPAFTGGPELWYAEAIAWSNGPAAWKEFDHQVMEDIIALHRMLGWEVIRFPWRHNIQPSRRLDERTFLCGDADGIHQIWQWDPPSMNFMAVEDTQPPPQVEDWPQLARSVEAGVDASIAAARASHGDNVAALQARLGDEMLVLGGGAGLSLGVDEPSLLAAVLEPEADEAILDCQLAVGLAQLEALARRNIRVVLGGGDMADKNGPLYSPEMFRRFMAPRWQKIADRCRELGLHYVWRSDGNLWAISDILFREIGFPGFGEVDYDAGMTTARVMERYPELTLWANLSGDLLRRATPDQVYAHGRAILEACDGRRHFYGCSNTILPGTPVDNVHAMMQARADFSTRPNPPRRSP